MMYKVREYATGFENPVPITIEKVCNSEYDNGWELVSLSVRDSGQFVCVFRRHSDFEV